MATAIEVNGLSKRYRRGAIGVRTLREEMEGLVDHLRGRTPRVSSDTFYALQDVSFSVNEGDICCVLGLNGSGKSTLLKILASITEPTSGEARLYGRVGSMLDVGAGFHPELSGYDNIFLSGAIAGMNRAEIARNLDSIVEFADIGPVLETPMKRYSPGMYVRLAFSVAAHLRADILFIDEVLAAGDMAFLRKCMSRLGEYARQGGAALIVSHNLATLHNVCSTGILLERGRLSAHGPAGNVIGAYMDRLSSGGTTASKSDGSPLAASVRIAERSSGNTSSVLYQGGIYDIVVSLRSDVVREALLIELRIQSLDGRRISEYSTADDNLYDVQVNDVCDVRFGLQWSVLYPGEYILEVIVRERGAKTPPLDATGLIFEVARNQEPAGRDHDLSGGVVRLINPLEVIQRSGG